MTHLTAAALPVILVAPAPAGSAGERWRHAMSPPRQESEHPQAGKPQVKPQRRFLRACLAIVIGVVGLFVFFLALLVFRDKHSTLSPLETRLVGEWSANPTETTRSFSPDRTFSTSNGQFVGVWRINNGRLTITYWQSFELPHECSFAAVAHSIRRTRKETVSWNITFAEDGRQHILSVPGEDRPDGQWLFRRVGNDQP